MQTPSNWKIQADSVSETRETGISQLITQGFSTRASFCSGHSLISFFFQQILIKITLPTVSIACLSIILSDMGFNS